jgi:site-specific DNA-adenine methylase
MKTKGKIQALAPWFGSNRSLAEHVGRALEGCKWVGVPFGGGMCELLHIKASSILVGDLHRHIINLAIVLQDGAVGPRLIRRLRRAPFHEERLANAQRICCEIEAGEEPFNLIEWAEAYFIATWMGRNGKAGTDDEFKGGLSVRYDANGGDSAMRFRNAVESLRDWRKIMPRCTFVVRNCFEFLDAVKDQEKHGVYCDPPFPEVGDEYKHKFTEDHHRKLAEYVSRFEKCRVVMRFYRHPLVEELYPTDQWEWFNLSGGKRQTNEAAPEVLLTNRQ